jgi:hypothetical protein
MITMAVNRAALRHHPFNYLLNIAANCRRAKAYRRSPKNMRRYSKRKDPTVKEWRERKERVEKWLELATAEREKYESEIEHFQQSQKRGRSLWGHHHTIC